MRYPNYWKKKNKQKIIHIKPKKYKEMGVIIIKSDEWLLCPVCESKTRIKLRKDTTLTNFPLFCPKCKKETLINVKELNIKIIKEPDAEAQSH